MTLQDLPLRGTAVYNPHLLARQELIDTFVARRALLEALLEDLRATAPESIAQHHLLVGQRGMGKTTLLRRLQIAIEDDAELAAGWLPLSFPEEQYNVGTLGDFWLNCLDALSDVLERQGRDEEAAELDLTVDAMRRESEGLERRALTALLGAAERLERRLLLLVDNTDLVFDRIGERDWAFREALSKLQIAFIGASAAAIESTYEYGGAFYDFFRVHELAGLSLEETRDLLGHYADQRGDDEVKRVLSGDPARVKTIHTLTGGNPRTVVLLYNVLAAGPDGDVRSDLEQLLDHCTPLYKNRFEALAPQAQQVVHALALRWDPATAGELAEDLRLDVNTVSAQLARLVRQGVVEKVPFDPPTKTGFQIGERLFNVWYLMRASRRVRRRLIWLAEFLRTFYSLAQGSTELEWLDLRTSVREAVSLGRAREAASLLDERGVADRWRPLREALEALARNSPTYLRRISPEVRRPAEELLSQLTASPPGSIEASTTRSTEERPLPAAGKRARRKGGTWQPPD